MKINSRGFTLVELLVTIAIIAILGSTILVSLRSAREKAKDVKVMSGIKQIKTTIESGYNGITYPDLTNDATKIYGGLVSDGNPGTSTLNVILGDIVSQGSDIFIVNDPAVEGESVLGYAVYGRLISTTTRYFCIDSRGGTNESAPYSSTATCPQ